MEGVPQVFAAAVIRLENDPTPGGQQLRARREGLLRSRPGATMNVQHQRILAAWGKIRRISHDAVLVKAVRAVPLDGFSLAQFERGYLAVEVGETLNVSTGGNIVNLGGMQRFAAGESQLAGRRNRDVHPKGSRNRDLSQGNPARGAVHRLNPKACACSIVSADQ